MHFAFCIQYAGVVELANTMGLGPIGAILAGSSPVTRTNNLGRYTKVVFYLYFD